MRKDRIDSGLHSAKTLGGGWIGMVHLSFNSPAV
jgi:hypothetical protein